MRGRVSMRDVVEVLGVSRCRIEYAIAKGDVTVRRPNRKYCRYFFTRDEVRHVAEYFGCDLPEEVRVA
jgi:hypothetical protein